MRNTHLFIILNPFNIYLIYFIQCLIIYDIIEQRIILHKNINRKSETLFLTKSNLKFFQIQLKLILIFDWIGINY